MLAERKLMVAIEQAEARYQATAALGVAFDRRLARCESSLRDAGYLVRDGHMRDLVPREARPGLRPSKSSSRAAPGSRVRRLSAGVHP
jgi:hypothetical protein